MTAATTPRDDRARRGWVEVLGVAAGVVAFVGVVWAARGELGMTWDEPYFFERQHDVRDWLGRVVAGGAERAKALSREGMERAWRFCREVPDQHPPVPELLGLATRTAFGWLLGPLRADRLSTVLLFAVASGVLFRFVRERWGPWAAWAALGALVFDPRPFADAQQITADSDTGAFWFLASVAFLRSCETGRRAWLFGVFAGLAVMCKATGVLVLPAMVLWALVHRPRGWWRPIAWAIPVMPAVMVAVMPPWWGDPVAGMVRWVRAFLAYPQKVPVAYLGRVYDSVHTFLPWHNTIVLTAVVVPVGLLVLTGVGLGGVAWVLVRRRGDEGDGYLPDRVVGSWAAINFGTWMVLRMTPFLPAHDGLRQLVPAFYFLPVLVGYGARILAGGGTGSGRATPHPNPPPKGGRESDSAVRGLIPSPLEGEGRVGGRAATARRWAGRTVVLIGIATAAWETLAIHPYELAYYNLVIGGPKGAKAAGMESTYFWDAATVEVLDWMNAHLPERSTVLIFPPPNVLTFGWEQRWGRLRRDLTFLNLDAPSFSERLARMMGPDPCYLIFQMRQGLYLPRRPGEPPGPFARLAESPALFEVAPRRVGVRLLAIFDRDQFARAFAGSARGP